MLRLRDSTVRWRFTVLYGAVFLVSGAGLLLLAFLLSGGDLSNVEPVPDQVPESNGELRDLQIRLAEADARRSRDMLVGSLGALLVLALVSIAVGRGLAKRVLRPLRRITAQTREISAENLHRRLAVTGPADEVKDLADTVDGLLERLEASFTAQRRFVADASHELRTPLATMRASLDVAAAKPTVSPQTTALAERLRPQLDQLDRLLDGLLVLARTDHGALTGPAVADLSDLAGQALAARAADIAAKDLRVTEDLESGLAVRGDTALLARMVGNIVDNAVYHNEEHGRIRVEACREGGEVRLDVHSGGPMLDPDEVQRLTRPFQRLGADRTVNAQGSGLGLTIAAAVADAHGGGLELVAAPTSGLHVRITLPTDESAS
jgi:signal transduction histidine kinase